MRLATIHTAHGTSAVRVEPDGYVELGLSDVGALLALDGWRERAGRLGTVRPTDGVRFAPVVPWPGKIVCVGLNYRNHILEMGRGLPEFPTLFAKYPEALVGQGDEIELAADSVAWDWEAELAVVIGATVRRADEAEATAAIAGFSVINDVTARDFQNRTLQWLQGKTFERTAPLGPVLVTPDDVDGGVAPALRITAEVNGEIVQQADTSELVFSPVALVSYISRIVTLRPGDVIATGTPGGVGHARKPPRYLADGDVVVTEIEGIGRLENTARAVR